MQFSKAILFSIISIALAAPTPTINLRDSLITTPPLVQKAVDFGNANTDAILAGYSGKPYYYATNGDHSTFLCIKELSTDPAFPVTAYEECVNYAYYTDFYFSYIDSFYSSSGFDESYFTQFIETGFISTITAPYTDYDSDSSAIAILHGYYDSGFSGPTGIGSFGNPTDISTIGDISATGATRSTTRFGSGTLGASASATADSAEASSVTTSLIASSSTISNDKTSDVSESTAATTTRGTTTNPASSETAATSSATASSSAAQSTTSRASNDASLADVNLGLGFVALVMLFL